MSHPKPGSPARWGVALLVEHRAAELRRLAARGSCRRTAELLGHDRRTVAEAATRLGLHFARPRRRPLGGRARVQARYWARRVAAFQAETGQGVAVFLAAHGPKTRENIRWLLGGGA